MFSLVSRKVSSVLGLWHKVSSCSTFAAAFFFFSPSLGSPELNGSCTIYLMSYCSCYHFAPKMFSSYSITLSLRLIVMLTYYSLLCLVNLTFWRAAQNSKHIWWLEVAVLYWKKKFICKFVTLIEHFANLFYHHFISFDSVEEAVKLFYVMIDIPERNKFIYLCVLPLLSLSVFQKLC